MDGRPTPRGARELPAPLQTDPPLSVQRAFVVHLGAFAAGPRRRFRGRVEHLTSGRATHFTSLRGLLAFFAATLGGDEAPPRPGRPPVR